MMLRSHAFNCLGICRGGCRESVARYRESEEGCSESEEGCRESEAGFRESEGDAGNRRRDGDGGVTDITDSFYLNSSRYHERVNL